MIVRIALLAAFLAAPFAVSTALAANNLSRREIRQMPITERPSRPGHFYGNAVRRNQTRPAGAVVSSGQQW
jgi:hypothetical protein